MIELTAYVGLAGDRNLRGMRGALTLGESLGRRVGCVPRVTGTPTSPVPGGWATQLEAATADLKRLGMQLGGILERGARPLTTMARCAASIATLPQIALRHPEAAIVWFDAHGDCNLPSDAAGYLGGMVLTGAAGRWDTGLGSGMRLSQVVLVGSRDLDPPERAMIARGEIDLAEIGPQLNARLRSAIAGRPIYVHIDCDVLDAGLAPTEYQVPGGLSFNELADACRVLAEHDVIGVEIAEFEGEWPTGELDDGARIADAIEPLLHRLAQNRMQGL
jgi:arginase